MSDWVNDIQKIVWEITDKYKTESPYELADLTNIYIHRNNLGQIHGFYHKTYRIKQIYLNCNLSRNEERFVLAHELGHSFLHTNANTPFLKASTYLSVDKMEIEANMFAMNLLVSDCVLDEYKECTIEQLSAVLGYHEKLVQMRIGFK